MSESGAHGAGKNTTPAWQRDTSTFVPLEQAAIDALNIEYTGIAIDSRKVKPGDLFIAYAGELADGRAYIPQALVAGAVRTSIAPPVDSRNYRHKRQDVVCAMDCAILDEAR